MDLREAVRLIRSGVDAESVVWADIGAGTGMFTQALAQLLNRSSGENRESGQGRIYAVDKSPHALWDIRAEGGIEIVVVEADFNGPLELPPLDGIVMANALHYAEDQLAVLKNVLECLKADGTLILVEYETEKARPPWVPHPVPFNMFESLCAQSGLSKPEIIGSAPSRYGYERIYAAVSKKLGVRS